MRKEINLDLKKLGIAIDMWDSIPVELKRGDPTDKFKVFCESLKKLENITANKRDVKFNIEYEDNKGTIFVTIDGYVSMLKDDIAILTEVMNEVDVFSICCLSNDQIEIELCFNDVFESKLDMNKNK